MPKIAEKNSKPDTTNTVQRFWNMVEVGADSAEIILYGEIVSQHPINWWTGEKADGLYISPDEFLNDLNKVKDKSKLTIRINSCGGDLYTGMAIYTQLKCLTAHKTVIIDGMAASAASLVAMAGDTVQIAAGGAMVIHDPLGDMRGTYNKTAIERVSGMLDTLANAAAETYANKTKLPVSEIRTIMTAETWLTGREAVQKGFADELLFDEPTINTNEERTMLFSNGVQMSVVGLGNIPTTIKVKNSALVDDAPLNNKGNQGGNKKMETKEDLQKEYPALVAELMKEATATGIELGVTQERTRLQAIENIQAAIKAPELVNEAKFGEKTCTAQELAFNAMQAQAEAKSEHLKNFKDDAATSGATNVVSAPNMGMEPSIGETNKTDADAVAMIVGGEKDD